MADDLFRIEWEGTDEFLQLLDHMEQSVQTVFKQEYTKFGLLVEEGAKALAPKDEGSLTDSIQATEAKATADTVEVEVTVNSAYAVRRHEEPPRMGVHDKYKRGAKFPGYYVDGRGERTRFKPTWRGYQPGRKFLVNAVEALDGDFDQTNDTILRRIMEEGT